MKNHYTFYKVSSDPQITFENVDNPSFLRKITLESLSLRNNAAAVDLIAIRLRWDGTAHTTQGREIYVPMKSNTNQNQAYFNSNEPLTIFENTSKNTKCGTPVLKLTLLEADGTILAYDDLIVQFCFYHDTESFYPATNMRSDYLQRNLVL